MVVAKIYLCVVVEWVSFPSASKKPYRACLALPAKPAKGQGVLIVTPSEGRVDFVDRSHETNSVVQRVPCDWLRLIVMLEMVKQGIARRKRTRL